mgnify:CR=1 FL=1
MRCYAPEAVERHHHYANECDVFMYSMVMYDTLEHERANAEMSTKAAIQFINRGGRPKVSSHWAGEETFNPGYVKVMHECWDPAPYLRPSFEVAAERLKDILATL